MKIVRTKKDVRLEVSEARGRGLDIGLVPTMGFFHAGHLSLMSRCRELSGFCVVSIFVNPTQFGPGEDFDLYPRDLERDLEMARDEGVDLVFVPSVEEMYAPDASTGVRESEVSRELCGAGRPGHFGGVATVVVKLFNIVAPDVAVFGRKDLQQFAVIRRVVRDLDLPVRVTAAPTVREADGLAMSSRNVYLSAEQRIRAPELQRALADLADKVIRTTGDIFPLLDEVRNRIEVATGGRIEYLSAVDDEMRQVSRGSDCRWLAAALHLGRTRLIDNVEVSPS